MSYFICIVNQSTNVMMFFCEINYNSSEYIESSIQIALKLFELQWLSAIHYQWVLNDVIIRDVIKNFDNYADILSMNKLNIGCINTAKNVFQIYIVKK